MFLIKLADGEELNGSDSDELTINHETGVLTVTRVDGFEETTTHFAPAAWVSVTHRKRDIAVRPALVPPRKAETQSAPLERTAASQ